MRIPHWFISTPLARTISKHQGVTYLCWTFVDLPPQQVRLAVHAGFRRHEYRHVQQSVVITLIWAALASLITPWLAVSALLAWPITYGVVSVVWKLRTGRGYTDNFFERDARRYARRMP